MEHPIEPPLYYQNLCSRCQFVEKPIRNTEHRFGRNAINIIYSANLLSNNIFETKSTCIGPKSN